MKNKITNNKNDLKYLIQNIKNTISIIFEKNKLLVDNIQTKNQLLNPKIPMLKGYALLLDSNNNAIKSIEQISLNQEIKIILNDGKIISQVKKVEQNEK